MGGGEELDGGSRLTDRERSIVGGRKGGDTPASAGTTERAGPTPADALSAPATTNALERAPTQPALADASRCSTTTLTTPIASAPTINNPSTLRTSAPSSPKGRIRSK